MFIITTEYIRRSTGSKITIIEKSPIKKYETDSFNGFVPVSFNIVEDRCNKTLSDLYYEYYVRMSYE